MKNMEIQRPIFDFGNGNDTTKTCLIDKDRKVLITAPGVLTEDMKKEIMKQGIMRFEEREIKESYMIFGTGSKKKKRKKKSKNNKKRK